MRVMCLCNKKTEEVATFEILDIGYDDDIFDVSSNENYDPLKDNSVSGLYMVDYRNDYLYIKGVTKRECKRICQELLQTGFKDLTSYGEYEEYDPGDTNEEDTTCKDENDGEDTFSSRDISQITEQFANQDLDPSIPIWKKALNTRHYIKGAKII